MEINGVAHTFITAGDFAKARAFYGKLLPFLGFAIVADTQNTFYGVGGRTGFGIHAPGPDAISSSVRRQASRLALIAACFISMPMNGRRTLPFFMSCSAIGFAMDEGTAKLRPVPQAMSTTVSPDRSPSDRTARRPPGHRPHVQGRQAGAAPRCSVAR